MTAPSGRLSDDGSPDARLDAALSAWRAVPGSATTAAVLAALPTARVFAAITATSTAEHVEAGTGLGAESSAEMALVTLVVGDERALPVFTSTERLRRWRLDARPVAVPGDRVCLAALEQGATTLLLDLDHAVTGEHLASLARGWVPVVGSGLASRVEAAPELQHPAAPPDPKLLASLARALEGEPVAAARLIDGAAGPVLGVVPERPLRPDELVELARRLVVRLGADLPTAGLDLAVVPAEGPGVAVPRARPRWRRRR